MTDQDEVFLKRKKLQLLREKLDIEENLPHLYGQKFYPWSREFFDSRNKYTFLCAANQVGKALDIFTSILTTRGRIPLKDVNVGDYVYSYNGKPTMVTHIPYEGYVDTLEITFDDGERIISSFDHLWVVKRPSKSWDLDTDTTPWEVVDTKELYHHYMMGQSHGIKGYNKFFVPVACPIEYDANNTVFDPRACGILLGSTYSLFSYPKFEFNEEEVTKGGIPLGYLTASVKMRKEFFKAFVEAGCKIISRELVFRCISDRMATDFQRLVLELGGKILKYKYKSLSTKSRTSKVMCHEFVIVDPDKCLKKGIKRITHLGFRNVKCLTVADSSGTFLCGEKNTVTHNSSIQIRKIIHWATAKDLWPSLWRTKPITFWYLYPTVQIADAEFSEKWEPNFMPRGKMKDHHTYGWQLEKNRGMISAIHFNSGVSIYFKSYAADVQNLQTSTLWYLACDEELPTDLFDELNMRLAANDGYFSMAFTATIGQEIWRQTMEESGEKERFKGACKIHATMYECLSFDDGTPSHWTESQIKRIENSCKSLAEIQKRVFGRFIKTNENGLMFPTFDRDKNVVPYHPVPPTWNVYVGVDIGSGGVNHPASIVFVATSPDYKMGRVIRGWRGDGIVTTVSDILDKFKQMKVGLNIVAQYYDYSSKEFQLIAARMGEGFQPADKSREGSEQVLNVLFKNSMLKIYDSPELEGLCQEIESLEVNEKKTHAKDDFIDALRYAICRIPWDWSAVSSDDFSGNLLDKKVQMMSDEDSKRRGLSSDEGDVFDVQSEIDAWNDLYDV